MPEETKATDGANPKVEAVPGAPGPTVDELKAENERLLSEVRRHSADAVRFKGERNDAKLALEELTKRTPKATPDATPAADEGELARLRRERAEDRAKIEAIEAERAMEKAQAAETSLESRLLALASEAKVVDPTAAMRLMKPSVKLAADGRTVMFTARNKDTGQPEEQDLTAANLKTSGLLGEYLFPAEGYPGAGGGQPREVRGAGSVDMARLGDREYWKKNKEKVLADLKARPRP